jgi:hypothetical protein
MRAGIVGNRHADQTNAGISLEVLKGNRGGGILAQVSATVDTGYGGIGGGGIAQGTGLHGVSPREFPVLYPR